MNANLKKNVIEWMINTKTCRRQSLYAFVDGESQNCNGIANSNKCDICLAESCPFENGQQLVNRAMMLREKRSKSNQNRATVRRKLKDAKLESMVSNKRDLQMFMKYSCFKCGNGCKNGKCSLTTTVYNLRKQAMICYKCCLPADVHIPRQNFGKECDIDKRIDLWRWALFLFHHEKPVLEKMVPKIALKQLDNYIHWLLTIENGLPNAASLFLQRERDFEDSD